MSKIPPALSRHVPGIPRELDLLIGAALAKNPRHAAARRLPRSPRASGT